MKVNWKFAVLGLLSLILLAGCTPNSPASPQTPGSSPSPTQIASNVQETQSLGDTSWILKSLGDSNNLTPALPGRTVTLRFYTSGSYMGSPGYTGSYGGAYKTEGNAISIGATTFSAVSPPDDPPGFLNQNQTYFTLLSQAQDFKIITGDELLINCQGSKSLLFNKAMDSTSATPQGTFSLDQARPYQVVGKGNLVNENKQRAVGLWYITSEEADSLEEYA